jgi:hypothetical protein
MAQQSLMSARTKFQVGIITAGSYVHTAGSSFGQNVERSYGKTMLEPQDLVRWLQL